MDNGRCIETGCTTKYKEAAFVEQCWKRPRFSPYEADAVTWKGKGKQKGKGQKGKGKNSWSDWSNAWNSFNSWSKGQKGKGNKGKSKGKSKRKSKGKNFNNKGYKGK